MIQEILKDKTIVIETTSSKDCLQLDGESGSYLINKSFNSDDNDYRWKITKLDEWGMIENWTEMFYSKNNEYINAIFAKKLNNELYS